MGYFGDTSSFRIKGSETSLGATTGFAANLKAAFDESRAVDTFVSEGKMRNDVRSKTRDGIEKATGLPFDEAIAPFLGPREEPNELSLDDIERTADGVTPTDRATDQLIDNMADGVPSGITRSNDIDQKAQDLALEKVARNADVYARSSGFSSGAGQFIGMGAAQMTDPLVFGTAPIGASAGARVIVAAGVEAALAGGITAAQLPAIIKWREKLDLPAGFEFGAQTVGIATAAGGVLGGGLRLLGRALNKLSNRDLVQIHKDLGIEPNADEALMIEHLSRKDHEAAAARASGLPEAEDARRLQEAVIHVDREGTAVPSIPGEKDVPAPPVRAPSKAEIDDIAQQADPQSPRVRGDLDAVEADMRRQIDEQGDFDIQEEVLAENGVPTFTTRKASAVLDEYQADREFIEQLEACAT